MHGGTHDRRARTWRHLLSLSAQGPARFADVDPPELLDHEGAEILLVGAEQDVSGELGIQLDAEAESRATADLCQDLRDVCARRPIDPLFRGAWA